MENNLTSLKDFKNIKYDRFISIDKMSKFIFNTNHVSYIYSVIISLILGIIFMIDTKYSIILVKDNIFTLITIFVTLLGFNLTGMGIILTTISKEVMKFLDENNGINILINMFGNFFKMSFLLVVQVIIYFAISFMLTEENISNIIGFITRANYSVIVTYIVIVVTLYLFVITLIFMIDLCLASINIFFYCKSKEIYNIDEKQMNSEKKDLHI